MAKSITSLRAFISGPSDVEDDKKAVQELLEHLNRTWLSVIGLQVQPRTAENLRPGSGQDAQAVINVQIEGEYDIFIALLWTRLGTETPRAPSGTAEEISAALEASESGGSRVDVMVYFKDADVPRSVDPQQLERVNEFRESIAGRALYSSYSDADDLSRKLHEHFSQIIEQRVESGEIESVARWNRESRSVLSWLSAEFQDHGFLDVVTDIYLLERGTEGSPPLSVAIIDMSNETEVEVLSGRHFTHVRLDTIVPEWILEHPDQELSDFMVITITPPLREYRERLMDGIRGWVGESHAKPTLVFGYINPDGVFEEIERMEAINVSEDNPY